MPEVTGVLSDQFVPGGEVDFQPSSETANVNGVAGAAIGGVAPHKRRQCKSSDQ